ncbi:MAG: 3-hydroxybutyryl-CoA dehydrogenase [Deltaproteobacteria bacterium RIFCSPLOWO2_12_FULL_60_19]|nr:MAG: 3-hydroxybutyryl-CoA dehydrogenase [Deltaproteobacteria bacterium RIFCSPLOWO2_12_FULL_60_19]
MEVKTIFVVGAGQMGSGIAQVAAQAGFQVLLSDVSEKIIAAGRENIAKQLERAQEKGKLQETVGAVLERIRPALDLSAGASADAVIEAVVEKEQIKKDTFKKLDGICPPHTIFASNTSSISITKIASATQRPEKVVGMHFFNPAPVMRLVEIVKGYLTSQETVETIRQLAQAMGKETILAKDYPGFLSTRIGMPVINEGVYALYQGLGSVEDIDKANRLGLNHPMGPLELADLVGIDTIVNVLEILYEGHGDPKYFPCPLLRQMVVAGHLGRKTGRGFYDYSGKEKKPAL